MAGRSDPNDPQYKNDPEHWLWYNNSWQKRSSGPSPGAGSRVEAENVGSWNPFVPFQMAPDVASSPGAHLNTGTADEDRARMLREMFRLSFQSKSGDGPWQEALKQSTAQNNASATALGQSMPGTGYAASLRGITNTQGANNQRAVGEANILRQQQKEQAQQAMLNLSGGINQTDSAQAAESAAAKQAAMQANADANAQNQKQGANFASGTAQGVTALAGLLLSDGGRVPGRPEVFGDDDRNDTVPAWLSPGEIVLPRTISQSPNAPEAAAQFVSAVKRRGGGSPKGFADGGGVGPKLGPDGKVTEPYTIKSAADSNGVMTLGEIPKGYGPNPSMDNGGLLDAKPYMGSRLGHLTNAETILSGPTWNQQSVTNDTDAALAAALQTAAAGRGGGSNLMAASGQRQQAAAGDVAGGALQKTGQKQATFVDAYSQQRARDLGFAKAEQQAAWRNSMMNAGISLQQQALLTSLLGGTGQAAIGFADMLGNSGGGGDAPWRTGGGSQQSSIDAAFNAAHGGEIPGYAFGDEIPGPPVETPLPAFLSAGQFDPYGDLPPAAPVSFGAPQAELSPLMDPETARAMRAWRNGADPFETAAKSFMPDENKSTFDNAKKIGGALVGGVADQLPFTAQARAYNNQTQDSLAKSAAANQLPPGVRPRGSAPKEEAAPTPIAPVATAPQLPAGYAIPKDPSLSTAADALKTQTAGLGAEAEVAAQLGKQKADEIAAYREREQQHALAAKEHQERAQLQANAAMTNWKSAQDEMGKIDATVDPGRYWASRSTGGKIAGIIGLALGALGAGNDGINRAAGMLEANINRDLEAQKAEHELKLKKGQAAVDSARSFYGMARDNLQDTIAADSAARSAMWGEVEKQFKLFEASAQGPMAKAQAQQGRALAQNKMAELEHKAYEGSVAAHLKKDDQNIERAKIGIDAAKAAGAGAKDKDLTEIESRAENMRRSLAKAKALISKTGTFEAFGSEQTELKKALSDYAIDSAKLKDPASAAREGEVATELAALGVDPGALTTSNATAQKLIDKALADINSRVDVARRARGRP